MQMTTVRIFFSKTGRAKYISHLDTMRTLTRALKRSGLPLWYTEGFNPHLYLTFALPLSLGYEGMCESLDVRLVEAWDPQGLVEALNRHFPPGFTALRAAEPVMAPKAIAWGDYDITLYYRPGEGAERYKQLELLLAAPAIEVSKRTKKGEKLVDIKPLVRLNSLEQRQDSLLVGLRCASGLTLNINPTLLLGALEAAGGVAPLRQKVARTAILTEDMQEFC